MTNAMVFGWAIPVEQFGLYAACRNNAAMFPAGQIRRIRRSARGAANLAGQSSCRFFCPTLTPPGIIPWVNDSTDQQLLRDYSERRSEAAFTELVRRHIDLVHSAAFRLTGEAHSAQDVTQAVFVALAQNAARLTVHPVLSGWLHTTARNLAAKNVRAAGRRQNHEQEAAAMNELLTSAPDASWEAIAPHLDAALGELSEPDRDAVLLRYFENKSAREMAGQLGISDDAAQKRVSRAVERLREFFAKRGVTVGSGGLALVISANAVHAAPVGLALTISTAAVLTGTTLATTATVTVTKAIAMTALQKTLVTVTIAVLAGAGIYEARQASQQREEILALQQQQATFAEQNGQLLRERDDSARQLAAFRTENARLNGTTAELLKLRGEVARLRMQLQELAQSKDHTPSNGTELALKSWLNRVNEFKRLPERMPDKAIPELQLLTDEDWLELAKKPLDHATTEMNLEDDATARLAFSAIRAKAKDKLMRVLSRALEGFANANSGQLPKDTLQLKPYLMNSHFSGPARAVQIPESVVDDTVLRRYEILQIGKWEDVPGDTTILAERIPVDSEYDTRLRVGRFWMGVGGLETYSPEKGATAE